MKTLTLKLVPQHSLGRNSTMGESYQAKCPFCAESVHLWPNEFKERKVCTDTTNVCLHFDHLTKDGRALMRPKMSVVAVDNVVRANGVILPRSMIQLIDDIEALEEEAHHADWIPWPAWCPKRRFDALKEEAWRVYKADPQRWARQHAARVEENERAELARLQAKYRA